MSYTNLQTVVLVSDFPERDLRAGDLGAMVEIYAPDGREVEFVGPSGRTQALVTLKQRDVRPVADDDLVAVGRAD